MRKTWKVITAGTAALVAGSSLAQAADLGRPREYPPAVVVETRPYNWSGLYLGGNIGAAWGNTEFSANGSTWTDSQTQFTGGGQVGYNWQMGNFVVGLDASMNWASLDLQSQEWHTAAGTLVGTGGTDWIGTLAGRMGFANDGWLIYGRFGGAWAHGSARVNNLTTNASRVNSDTVGGWVVGGGLEYALSQNWTTRLQYDYIRLEERTVGGLARTDNNVQLLTVGVNYKF